ncbi:MULTISPECIES: hypothetical protein [unclassified Frankia]|uniref:hypothetical protein n=1 Tax=unclassified Frankia TaxID=2632575 RepID=UPI002AD25A90|nr:MULTISPECIES: hypothetical protein [unclassified Frankia]
MLVRVAIAASFFDDPVLNSDRYQLHAVHRSLTAVLTRHAEIVCLDDTEVSEYRRKVNTLPSTVKAYWDPIFGRAGLRFRIHKPQSARPSRPAMSISNRKDLLSWRSHIDHFLVGTDQAREFGFSPNSDGRTDGASGICISSYRGVTPKQLWEMEELNSRYYRAGQLSRDDLWNHYIKPLVIRAPNVVLIDKYAGKNLQDCAYLWKKISETPSPNSKHGRTIQILTHTLLNENRSNRESAEPKMRGVESFARNYEGTTGIAEFNLTWLPKEAWGTKRKDEADSSPTERHHDRHFRFEKRTLSISSGLDYIANPEGMDGQLTYRCEGDRHSTDFKNILDKERILVAAAGNRSQPLGRQRRS